VDLIDTIALTRSCDTSFGFWHDALSRTIGPNVKVYFIYSQVGQCQQHADVIDGCSLLWVCC